MKLLSILSLSIMATAFSTAVLAENHTANTPIQLASSDAAKEKLDAAKEKLSDARITTDVKGKFVKDKLFGSADVNAMSISVETNKGVVHLTGTADSQEQIDNANKIARSADGVKNVVNDVKVKNKEVK